MSDKLNFFIFSECKVLNNGTEELDDEIRTFLSDTDPAKNLVLELDIDGNSVTSKTS